LETENSAAQDEATAIYLMKKVYLKDLSFESPNARNIFRGDAPGYPNPEMRINIRVTHIKMENHEYEVAIRLTFHAVDADNNSIFLAEVEHAGIFMLKNIPDEHLEHYLKVDCPRSLYPFARQIIWSIIGWGSFPPMLVQNFDFDAMHKINSEAETTDD